MRKFLTAEEFRQAAKDKTLADAGTLRHLSAEVEKGAEGSRALTFTISTEDVDRMGDIIAVNGWDLENFNANPVVLWAHNSRELPIARATKVWKYGKKLKATAEFVPADMPVIGPLAEAVFQMYQGGFLNATSVGMLPKKWAWSTDDARPFGIDFQEHELLEFSAVPIPANPNALIGAKAAGIDTAPVFEWARALLKDEHPVDVAALVAAVTASIKAAEPRLDGFYCQNCSKTVMSKQGDTCEPCRALLAASAAEQRSNVVPPHEFRRRQIEIARLG